MLADSSHHADAALIDNVLSQTSWRPNLWTAYGVFRQQNSHKIPSAMTEDGRSDIGQWNLSLKAAYDSLTDEETAVYRLEAEKRNAESSIEMTPSRDR